MRREILQDQTTNLKVPDHTAPSLPTILCNQSVLPEWSLQTIQSFDSPLIGRAGDSAIIVRYSSRDPPCSRRPALQLPLRTVDQGRYHHRCENEDEGLERSQF